MTEPEFERRIKALQQEVTAAYLKGYEEARQRAQWTINATMEESERLRAALESALDEVRDEATRVHILKAMHRSTQKGQLNS